MDVNGGIGGVDLLGLDVHLLCIMNPGTLNRKSVKSNIENPQIKAVNTKKR